VLRTKLPARAVAAELGRDGTVIVTSDGAADELITVGVSASDVLADVTATVTRDSPADDADWSVVVTAVAPLEVVLVELKVVSSWRALLSSYEQVSSASSTTERLLSGNSAINLLLAVNQSQTQTEVSSRDLNCQEFISRYENFKYWDSSSTSNLMRHSETVCEGVRGHA